MIRRPIAIHRALSGLQSVWLTLALLVAMGASATARAQTGQWAWMGGSNDSSLPGVYGTLNQAAAENVPGGRLGAVSWTNSDGKLWLFGGAGFDSNGTFGFLNDLWEYDPAG
ncbi:MAG: kelch repeat-containing protein [Terracidiphilus sp.]